MMMTFRISFFLALFCFAPRGFANTSAIAQNCMNTYKTAMRSSSWQEWYVDNSWTGAVDGSITAPFTNIQEAIDFVVTSNGAFCADTLLVKDTGRPYYGPIIFPNMNALRLKGWNGRPVITLTGAVSATTIMSGTNYFNPIYACMPPAQVGLENLRIENQSTVIGDYFCVDVQTWVSWENPDPSQHRYGISNVVFNGNGIHGGIRLRDLDQGHMVPWGIPYNNFHTSLVQACHIEECRTGVEVMPMQCAILRGNWFVSNTTGIAMNQTTNWPYLRLYDSVYSLYNIFAWCDNNGIAGGVYSNLVYQNNTFYDCGTTGLLFSAGQMAPYGNAQLYNNIFYANGAGWHALVSMTNMIDAAWNLYYTNAVQTGWEAFGFSNIYENPLLTIAPTDEWFLHPEDGSPAAHVAAMNGATFIGALPPIPEPFLGIIPALFAMLCVLRRDVH